MRTVMRAAAVAAAAVATIAGTAGAASAAPATPHYATLSVAHTEKANTPFHLYGTGYDARTNSGELCLQGRIDYRGHWSNWQTVLCEAHRSGHKLAFDGVARTGWPAGTYDLRMVLVSHPRAGVWKPLDYSSQHILTVR
ncbi:hypothetical protein [Streptacidiphilus jiangxiensis]|uniref:Secreted protein n=1 Tax=Streptacidiphilus jiangxiensis TaxID=235985 RepID=A0A1H7RY19_STRJI|nr:hypothetical protein [Streptacidiphilus jiangxiensis]SEL65190.1 hypothetical protein SAMN05414137_11145 [Streptacidiphilus jiangxiensis]